jgi:hypothetical protein
LLTPDVSPSGSFSAVVPVLIDCSLCDLLCTVLSHLPGHSCSRLGHLSSISLALVIAIFTDTSWAVPIDVSKMLTIV